MLAKRLLIGQAVPPTPPPALAVSAPDYFGLEFVSGPTLVTGSSSATAVNGTPPYSYSWVKVSGDGSIQSGETTNTVTVGVLINNGETKTGVYRVTVTDNNLDTATDDVTFQWETGA